MFVRSNFWGCYGEARLLSDLDVLFLKSNDSIYESPSSLSLKYLVEEDWSVWEVGFFWKPEKHVRSVVYY